MTTTLEIAGMIPCTDAEGPHSRFAVWVQGCTLACPGCCNPEMFVPGAGRRIEIAALDRAIARARRTSGIEGITILGGEPLQQIAGVTALCRAAAARSLGVVVFTGYTHAQARTLDGWADLWPSVDTLVDGRFEAAHLDGTRRFIGSANQRLVHRTARYAAPELWAGEAAVEVELGPDGTVTVVGNPALARRVVRRLPVAAG